jgi:dipeptidyl aminopeptidase/acylaminoacyl peptidase
VPRPVRSVLALLVLALTSAVVARAILRQTTDRVRQATINLPSGVSFASDPAQFSLSPDGRSLAVVLKGPAGAQIWTWALDGVDARAIAGTDGVSSAPVWSPDGREIAFVSGGRLRRMPAGGGRIETICSLADGATFDWGEDGTLLIAAGGIAPIQRVAATAGGTIQQISTVYPDEQHLFPRFVPGLRRFLFFVASDEGRDGLWLGSLDGGRALRVVPHGVNAAMAGDVLAYPLDRLLIAQRFDPATAEFRGMPVTVADHVRADPQSRRYAYAISAVNPVLVFQSETDGALHLIRNWTSLLE